MDVPSVFGSGLWDRDHLPWTPDLGEPRPIKPRWYNGANPAEYAGKCKTGNARQWLEGLTAEEFHNPPPLPLCCRLHGIKRPQGLGLFLAANQGCACPVVPPSEDGTPNVSPDSPWDAEGSGSGENSTWYSDTLPAGTYHVVTYCNPLGGGLLDVRTTDPDTGEVLTIDTLGLMSHVTLRVPRPAFFTFTSIGGAGLFSSCVIFGPGPYPGDGGQVQGLGVGFAPAATQPPGPPVGQEGGAGVGLGPNAGQGGR